MGWSALSLVSDSEREYQRNWRAKQVRQFDAAGLCTRCGGERDGKQKWCSGCRQQSRDFEAGQRAKGVCKMCKGHAIKGQTRCPRCAEAGRLRQKQSVLKARALILDRYGDKCACCGETNPIFLTIDHLNNDGHKHRSFSGGGGGWLNFIALARKYGWSADVQILCFNCNCGRARNGGVCPHKVEALKEAM